MSSLFSGAVRRLIALAMALTACAPSSLVEVAPPGNFVDPAVVTTESGAVLLFNKAVSQFELTIGHGATGYIALTGLMTDEVMKGGNSAIVGIDERMGDAISSSVYGTLHLMRLAASQAREAVRRYGSTSVQALRGRLYAQEGFSILYFAEVYCSGIPLSTVPLDGVPVRAAGLSTAALFERTVALFDSAMSASGDSARFVQLARIGKGRALLGLGRFAEAAEAVRDVPTDFQFSAVYNSGAGGVRNWIGDRAQNVHVVDGEGTTGLTWSNDPRTAVTTAPSIAGTLLLTAKYSRTGGTLNPAVSAPDTPIRIADGLEARLIEAEASLASGGTAWLATLNTLRATCIGATACAPVPGLTALPPLADPIAQDARLDLLMRERAMWLYLTGHRQGDLRRLARIYQRPRETLWPTGTYVNPGSPPIVAAGTHGTAYGDYVVLPVLPGDEANQNPQYQGCFDLEP